MICNIIYFRWALNIVLKVHLAENSTLDLQKLIITPPEVSSKPFTKSRLGCKELSEVVVVTSQPEPRVSLVYLDHSNWHLIHCFTFTFTMAHLSPMLQQIFNLSQLFQSVSNLTFMLWGVSDKKDFSMSKDASALFHIMKFIQLKNCFELYHNLFKINSRNFRVWIFL